MANQWLSLSGITKRHSGQRPALEGVTLALSPGIVGLIGPNGAGKTTLMQILSTLTRPTAGQYHWQGHDVLRDPDQVRRELGYLPQHLGVYGHLTALEFLQYLGAMRGLPGRRATAEAAEHLSAVGLSKVFGRPLATYSGGMLRRVGIAQALLGDPRLILLDEPTAGLDPAERMRVRNLLESLARDRLILLSTHDLSDLEAVANHLLLMRRGRLLWQGSPDELIQRCAGKVWQGVAGMPPVTPTLGEASAWALATLREGEP